MSLRGFNACDDRSLFHAAHHKIRAHLLLVLGGVCQFRSLVSCDLYACDASSSHKLSNTAYKPYWSHADAVLSFPKVPLPSSNSTTSPSSPAPCLTHRTQHREEAT